MNVRKPQAHKISKTRKNRLLYSKQFPFLSSGSNPSGCRAHKNPFFIIKHPLKIPTERLKLRLALTLLLQFHSVSDGIFRLLPFCLLTCSDPKYIKIVT